MPLGGGDLRRQEKAVTDDEGDETTWLPRLRMDIPLETTGLYPPTPFLTGAADAGV